VILEIPVTILLDSYFSIWAAFTGILLIIFFTWLYQLYNKVENKKLLIIAQIIGLFSAFASVMVGIFSEDYWALY